MEITQGYVDIFSYPGKQRIDCGGTLSREEGDGRP